VDPTASPSVSTLPALQQPGGLAAPGEVPVLGTGAEAMASEGPLPPTSHFAAAAPPQGTHYPSVADLEVAGERQAACALDTEHASAVGLQA
jgi:hypothetical protein